MMSMFHSFRQLLRIACTTALEGLQQTIVLLLTLSGVLLTALQPLVSLYTFGEEGRLARDSGLALLLVLGLFIVAFTAGATLHDELRRGTAAAVLAKPVPRPLFLLGKWLGVLGVLLLFAFTQTLSTLLAERTATHFIETRDFLGSIIDPYTGIGSLLAIALSLLIAALLNYFRQTRFALATLLLLPLFLLLVTLVCSFITRAGSAPDSTFAHQLNLRVLPVALLILALLSLYAAIATTLSTRLAAAPTALSLGILLFLGFLAESSLARASSPLLRALYTLIPDVQHFWLTDTIAADGHVPLRYLAHAALATLSSIAFWLGLGCFSLAHKDIG